jgi:hypothetical protein
MHHRSSDASAGDSSPDTRPLPPRPSLEFERKQAKALLRRLRAGDADAIARARARHDAFGPTSSPEFTLADAQLVIAREYGFVSWPRLVQYFGDVERRQLALRTYLLHDRKFYESSARSLITDHASRRAYAGSWLAASVPRFYGKTAAEVFATGVSEDDARLTVARQHGYPSWEVLMEMIASQHARHADPWRGLHTPFDRARKAILAGDLDALRRVVDEYPDLLRPSAEDRRDSQTVVAVALGAEERNVLGARAITDWLASQGADVNFTLSARLCGRKFETTETVRFLLERGADPNWTAPNGISVLEHALLTYWNGEAVDLIAPRVTPKSALWIAAGLGDVEGVSRFLDRNGKPTGAAFRDRPDFVAVGEQSLLATPVPDDTEILAEAFMVALLNDRIAVLDYMIDRGFPVDYLGWEMTFLTFAVGNQRLRAVECLVRRGADLDLRGPHGGVSARTLARGMFENAPADPRTRRIFELCGAGDPVQVIAEMEARPGPEPQSSQGLEQALELAADDAARRGQNDVRPENLVIGTLRVRMSGAMDVMRMAKVDMDRMQAAIGTRVLRADDRVQRGELPLDGAAKHVLDEAFAIARQRKQEVVNFRHLLTALSDADDAFLRDLLLRCGSSVATLKDKLDENVCR